MNRKLLKSLEFHRVVEMLEECTNTSLGKELSRSVSIYTEVERVIALQAETTEAQTLIFKGMEPSIQDLNDISKMLYMGKIGSKMDLGSLLSTAHNLRLARTVSEKLRERSEDAPILFGMANQLFQNRELEERIFFSIVNEEELSDDASPELRSIRREMRLQNDRIRQKLDQIVSSSASKYLQDAIVTMRQDRYVIPVKMEYRSQVPGIVHDTSASGATLFVEPAVVVEMNNSLRILQQKEFEEIDRIIRLLSSEAGAYHDQLLNNQALLAKLDHIMAKGKLSVRLKGISPKINRNKIIILKSARHPLLDISHVVPLEFRIGDGYSSLIITGPNTGGKTVAIKTVGLLTMMLQAGLHVPCDYGSSMYVFDQIHADIGDDQSISQNLSTFSSHMKHIVEILDQVTNRSLVILDELGSGTDPDEGSALAIAILEFLKRKKVTTLATTHYSNLKNYALNTEFVENASVEFDVQTLSPTFRLLIGVPGKSNAFNISRKLGLREDIIRMASEHLSEDTVRMEDLLIRMDRDRREIEREKSRIQTTSENIHNRLANIETKERKLQDQKDRAVLAAKREAKRIVDEARAEANQILKELRLIQKSTTADLKKAEQLGNKFSDLDRSTNYNEPLIREPEIQSALPEDEIKVGSQVFVTSFGQNATIVSLHERKKQVVVQMGNMKINIPYSAISKKQESKDTATKGIGGIQKRKATSIQTQYDIRGLDAEDARSQLSKYLDDAFLSNIPRVTIIHGVGTGALRQMVDSLLRSLSYVSEFRSGDYGEGGQGVTVVKFK